MTFRHPLRILITATKAALGTALFAGLLLAGEAALGDEIASMAEYAGDVEASSSDITGCYIRPRSYTQRGGWGSLTCHVDGRPEKVRGYLHQIVRDAPADAWLVVIRGNNGYELAGKTR